MSQQQVLELAKAMISTPETDKTAETLSNFLSGKNVNVEVANYRGKPVVLAFLGAEEAGEKVDVLMLGHTDVAPPGPEELWDSPPFSAEVEEGVPRGRGASDGKGPLASAAVALAELAEGANLGRSVALLALPDAENDYESLDAVKDLRAESAIVLEPTFTISAWSAPILCISQRGGMLIRIVLRGSPAHRALSWYGENPILRLGEVLNAVSELWPSHQYYPTKPGQAQEDLLTAFLLGAPTPTPIDIRTETAAQGTPTKAEITVYIPTTPNREAEELLNSLKSKVDETNTTIETVKTWKFLDGNPESWLVKALHRAIFEVSGQHPLYEWYPWPTAANRLIELGITKDFAIFGPGDFRLSHRPNEYVGVQDLAQAVEIYKRVLGG